LSRSRRSGITKIYNLEALVKRSRVYGRTDPRHSHFDERHKRGPKPTAGSQRPFDFLAALQLQTIAPNPLSHVGSDLQLLEAFIWLQSLVPIQAHLRSPP
jgi:hypothetical protein